jgi:hypothetical protein
MDLLGRAPGKPAANGRTVRRQGAATGSAGAVAWVRRARSHAYALTAMPATVTAAAAR